MSTERNRQRETFANAWNKHKLQQPLSDLEKHLVEVIALHPEYIDTIENLDQRIDHDYSTDNNPFLHLSLHLSLQEQIKTNRPQGISDIYQSLLNKHQNIHQVEHLMMDVLAHTLWDAQQSGQLPDEKRYLLGLSAIQ